MWSIILNGDIMEEELLYKKDGILEKINKNNFSELNIAIKSPDVINDEKNRHHLFTLSLKKVFEIMGFNVVIHKDGEWYSHDDKEDIIICLRGSKKYKPYYKQINILWNLSASGKVSKEEYETYDVAFISPEKMGEEINTILKPIIKFSKEEIEYYFDSPKEDKISKIYQEILSEDNIFKNIGDIIIKTLKNLEIDSKIVNRQNLKCNIYDEPIINSCFNKYITSRIDIKNYGSINNNLEIIKNSDKNARIDSPSGLKNDKGRGIIIQSTGRKIDLKLRCIKDGILAIVLRGVNVKDRKGNRFPIYIDYNSLTINKKEYIENSKLVWHDEPFIIRRRVKNNELITIHIEWMPFTSSSLYENKKIKELKELTIQTDERIKELEEENEDLKKKLSLISNSNLLEINKIKKEL